MRGIQPSLNTPMPASITAMAVARRERPRVNSATTRPAITERQIVVISQKRAGDAQAVNAGQPHEQVIRARNGRIPHKRW